MPGNIYECRTAAQRRAKATFEALLADASRADAAYNALGGSDAGRVISTDLVRELDVAYQNWSSGSGPRDLAPSWSKAWVYAQDRFLRELARVRENEIVRFMAGGWAAGKTRVVKHLSSRSSATGVKLTWDGTLKDTPWARRQIRTALRQGARVEIVYVHRNIELALYGAVDRARQEGRAVPLADLPGNHRAVQLAIRSLIRSFGDNANVSFSLFHNVGTSGLARIPMAFGEDELAPSGALHYRTSHEQYYTQATKEIEAVCG